jgi:pSer/pThr/pTyr-binding forkhead associated (FHA) protein
MQRNNLIPASRLARLVVVDRDRIILLKTGANTVGRLPHNDVVVDAPQVSRRHCILFVHPSGSCHIQDSNSKRGTTVNGKRVVAPSPVRSGDEIRLGDYRVVIQDASGSDFDPSMCCLRPSDWSDAETLVDPV